jgi:hypothetical protein
METITLNQVIQDKNSLAWNRLCDYIDLLAENELEVFEPRKALGDIIYSQICTLPRSISKLKKVKKMDLYRSSLFIIPPEIGEMESLETIDPYMSDNLKWFPYELVRCKNLNDSRISTRMIFGNEKNRKPFPDLNRITFKYDTKYVRCSICEKIISYEETNQLWITLRLGTDYMPLLANLCSYECQMKLKEPAYGFNKYPHKGGEKLIQPTLDQYEIMDYYTKHRKRSRRKIL